MFRREHRRKKRKKREEMDHKRKSKNKSKERKESGFTAREIWNRCLLPNGKRGATMVRS